MGNPINFYPSLVKAFGNRNVAIFIGQMGYWRDRITDKEGRIYKTAEEIEDETSLTYKEQIYVRNFLKKKGILTEKYYRSIHRLYFKINWQKVDEIWEEYLLENDSTLPKVNCHLTQSKFVNRNTENTTDINLPAIAGKQFCENCKEDKMCDKCEMLKKKIEVGTEYGFEFDVKNSKEMLKNLTELHKNEDPTENKKVTQNERIVTMMQGSKDEYADRLVDYPDRCRKPLNYFLHKWNFSPSSVPKKSKSKGGAFATWINGIDELVAISGEKFFELVLDKTYETWYNRTNEYKNVVDMPQKIKPLFTSCNNIVRQEIAEKMQEEVKKEKEKVEEKKEFVSAEDGAKLLKQLQKSLKKGKEE